MAKIRHIAMTSDNPSKLADFYKEVFGMTEVRRSENGQVFLTDGYINMALLNYKTPNDEDPGPNGGYYDGIHHIGFQVDDIEAAAEKLDKAGGARLSRTATPGTGGSSASAPARAMPRPSSLAPTAWCWTCPSPAGRPKSRCSLPVAQSDWAEGGRARPQGAVAGLSGIVS